MEYSDLTPEQKTKAKSCETPEELVALAQEEGLELTDAQLDAVSGGWASGCDDGCNTQCNFHDHKRG